MKNTLLIAAILSLSGLFSLNCLMFPDSYEELTGKLKSEKIKVETSNTNGFAVVELFTSEGCSSCPPADELIAKLQNETTDQNVYFLAYHVDYWDRLGWKDQFSSNQFTVRQQQYQNWLNLYVMYTPQFIINGTTEFAGYYETALSKKITDALSIRTNSNLELTAKSDDTDSINIHFKTNEIQKNTNLFIAVVQKEAISKVARGENKGNTLHHVQIVRQLKSFAVKEKDGNIAIEKPVNFNTKDWELIGFLQNTSTGKISTTAKVPLM
ncbi:thioredoxin family protein [[Flexibacter] sp. ATCC 35103]|uniref:DUF1223 domain-containing protein n=1 Tax=[Flexibacter] sp. ATCC 35103 TaxID=1937528 RepID=UPI0009D4F54F|nr:DUF1223 domain-containing protein [[Flexibacter] sp. ATCC 35103]OMQ10317.1 hypothetical protein BXU01_13615 [[Flexibacter] sp. ATCC 35103]